MTELHWMTAQEIRSAYMKRDFSPVDLAKHLIKRVEKHNASVDAFISIDPESILKAAGIAEKEIFTTGMRSALHGIPVGIKDMINVAGDPTSCHSRLAPRVAAAKDANVITQLRSSGAILFGKLAMHEYAIGGPAFDLPYPPARNPWNRAYHPGGSSSGSGVAVAAGFVPLALGTDTGGSIRNPAGACGIVGLKPTYEAVSRQGVVPLSQTLDHVGPLARSVADIALMMGVIADPSFSPGSQVANPWALDALERDAGDLRLGFVRHFHTDDIVADEEIIVMLEGVVRAFSGAGASVKDVKLPSLVDFNAVQRIIFQAEPWTLHADNLRRAPQDYAEISRTKLLTGAFTSVSDYIKAMELRTLLTAIVDEALRDVDVLIVANALACTPEIENDDECRRTYPLQARGAFNLTGHPAIALMSGISNNGLPLSVQLVGRYGDELAVLQAARAFERMSAFADSHPDFPAD
jgi:aspartyl-tRNA(Asn)/glutamyl-tRNA(Gln) amidotransferase subunit A